MEKKQGRLYIVPTPIGNLGDMTFRGVEVLKTVDLIGAEDTRTSRILLDKYEIGTPVVSYHKFNEKKRALKFLADLDSGKKIAIISDAGSPGISDPALILINLAIENRIEVDILPGANAVIPALLQSKLYHDSFHFCGYLPEKMGLRKSQLEKLRFIEAPLVFFVGPHDLNGFFKSLLSSLGNRRISICRELTKLYETIYRDRLETFLADPEIIEQRGEFVVVVEGYFETEIDEKTVEELLKSYLAKGISTKEAVKIVGNETGIARNRIYQLALKLKNK